MVQHYLVNSSVEFKVIKIKRDLLFLLKICHSEPQDLVQFFGEMMDPDLNPYRSICIGNEYGFVTLVKNLNR